MERASKMDGMLFWGKTIDTNNSAPMGKHFHHKQQMDSVRLVSGNNDYHIRVDIQTFFLAIFKKTRMAQMKLSWILLHWLGIPIAAVAWYENLDNWKGGAMTVLGCVSMACYIFLTYQKARKIKLENDEKEFDFNLKKYRPE